MRRRIPAVAPVLTASIRVKARFIEDILGHLGATADQIDRERARAHRELVA